MNKFQSKKIAQHALVYIKGSGVKPPLEPACGAGMYRMLDDVDCP